MRLPVPLAFVLALVLPLAARADDPPTMEHQPWLCAIPGKAISICASISDDSMIAKARVYFRPSQEKFYSFVEMGFGGLSYCATLPAPREGKARSIDYYLQATDDGYNTQRTSTFQMPVQPEGVCAFPPIEKDLKKAASITVYATNSKQGKKLPDEFEPAGVTFVPLSN